VNPAPSSGMDGTPDPFRPGQRPLVSSPGLCSVVCANAAFSWSGCLRLAATSVAFHRPLSPRGPLTSNRPATLLSIALRRCRPAACLVCTPPLSRIRPGQSPLVISPGPSHDPERRRLSSRTTPESRRRHFTRALWAVRRFSCCAASRMLRSACYPPDPQPRSGPRRTPAFSGFPAT
jgi:hypothetical protein